VPLDQLRDMVRGSHFYATPGKQRWELRAAALRDKECAIATSQAAPIAPRFLPALPPPGNRILAGVAFEA
jgi:hypothetical protein